MISSAQQQQLSIIKTEKRPSTHQLCAQLSRNRCISWSLNVVLMVATIVLLLVAPHDVVQAAFCLHLFAFCTTCAVFVWTKDSQNAFVLSVGFSIGHFVVLLFSFWDCEPLFFVLKLSLISCLWFGTRLMRITGARLIIALEHKPRSRVRVTIVQILIGASLIFVASLHLAYPEHEALSFAEMALWGCYIVDVLWHYGVWKMNMKRVFRDIKGMRKRTQNSNRNMISNLTMIEGARRRQIIITTVGCLFTEIISCASLIFSNPALGLLLQDKSNECKQRNSIGSHRVSAFGFAVFLAFHINLWLTMYTHLLKKWRSQKRGLHVSALQQVAALPHHSPDSGLAKTYKASEREMNFHSSASSFVLPHYTHE
jgi:hypothetical protein